MSTGDVGRFADVTGTTEVNYNGNDATEWAITVVTATTFSLDGTDGDDGSDGGLECRNFSIKREAAPGVVFFRGNPRVFAVG